MAEIFCRQQAIGRWYIFSPHLISVSTLPCKTENTEIMSFHLNVVCCFANRQNKTHQNYHLTIHRLPCIRKTIDCIGLRQITTRLGKEHQAIRHVHSQHSPCLHGIVHPVSYGSSLRRTWKVSVTINQIFYHSVLTGKKHVAKKVVFFSRTAHWCIMDAIQSHCWIAKLSTSLILLMSLPQQHGREPH